MADIIKTKEKSIKTCLNKRPDCYTKGECSQHVGLLIDSENKTCEMKIMHNIAIVASLYKGLHMYRAFGTDPFVFVL